MKEVEVKKTNDKNKIITKDRVIAFVIGLFMGAIIASSVFCICRCVNHNKIPDNGMFPTQENRRPNMPRKYNRQDKKDRKTQSTEVEPNESTDTETQKEN